MAKEILKLIAAETAGESYRAHKMELDIETDTASRIDNPETRFENPRYGETKKFNGYILLKNFLKNNSQVLTYFLDGSRHVYKVDEIAYRHGARKMVYPIIAGQVAVGCCRRQNKKLHAENFFGENILTLPDIANANGSAGFLPALTQKINALSKIEISKILEYSTSQNVEQSFENRAIIEIQNYMYQAEQNMVAALVAKSKLNQKNFLVKDGSLEYRIPKDIPKNSRRFLTFKNNFNYVIGVSKKFNPALFTTNNRANPGFIAELPLYNRTPVICTNFYEDIKIAIWYLRIRDRKFTDSPFDGVLKVEKMLVAQDEISSGVIDSEFVNFLSAQIINERNPVCYGADNRWANHIYPIFLTETFIKSKCIAAETFLNLF